ncbi:MAG: AAA family ATPase, partial [Acidobacteriota bacterium]|nr:AAA family ATPase [Acidobacteriota bacterium]
MYEEFFSYFALRANPFHVSPDPRFYIPTPAYESALSEIKFGIETRQGLMVLTGDAGTGKTTLMQLLLEWLHESGHSSSYIFHSLLEPADLFSFILRDFGIPCVSTEKGKVLQALHQWLIQRHAQGDTPVIVIDEAQVLLPRTLDELRLLLNLETPAGKLVQIVLAGQQELEGKLRRPELRQLRQRIAFHSRIAKMTLEETANYISSRLASAGGSADVFPAATVESIHKFSSGIPRVVNLLCEHSLIGAYAGQEKNVSQETVQRVAADFDLAAKPMAWESSAEASRYSRLLLFPLTEAKPETAVANAAAASTPAGSAHTIHPARVATASVGIPLALAAATANGAQSLS